MVGRDIVPAGGEVRAYVHNLAAVADTRKLAIALV